MTFGIRFATCFPLILWLLALTLPVLASADEIEQRFAHLANLRPFSEAQKNAEKSNALAECEVAAHYYAGVGVKQNINECLVWLRKSVDDGNIIAQSFGGVLSMMQSNYTDAVVYFRKAADQGDAMSQMQVARCYHEGWGVQQDKTEALKWTEKAANQGKVEAEFLAGMQYYVGLDVKADEKKGIEWIEKAANQGEPAALHYLSAAYYLGRGKPQDYLQAYIWELVFVDSSRIMIPDDAESLRARIADVEQKLTPEQIKKGKAEAQKLKNRLSKLPRYSATD